MNKAEARQHAKRVVVRMLSGRCQPEADDVEDITSNEDEQGLIVCEIYQILQQLQESIEG